MPELPEVEVVRLQLLPHVRGQRVIKVTANAANYFFSTPPAQLKKALKSERILDLRRQGKFLFFELESGKTLLAHLGMTGQICFVPAHDDEHVHLRLMLENGKTLHFRDVRKFGKVRLLAHADDYQRELSKLGVDGLLLRASTLFSQTQASKQNIKAFLLSQKHVAGVGNIYADEALFAASIRPTRIASSLKKEEVALLCRSLRRILKNAIQKGGSTIDDFLQPGGRSGSYQQAHQVYGQGGKQCPRCKTQKIEKITLATRGTHFCPACQT